ncbi:MAG: hypothetical protein J6D29_05800 [Solobacterium sp.]|nr:hypothetical protein [Solobacterium sp.]
MKDENMINDELLKIISGGKLQDGWQETVLAMIARNKGPYINNREKGIRYMKFIIRAGIGLPESTPNEWELRAVDSFIDENYDKVEPLNP